MINQPPLPGMPGSAEDYMEQLFQILHTKLGGEHGYGWRSPDASTIMIYDKETGESVYGLDQTGWWSLDEH